MTRRSMFKVAVLAAVLCGFAGSRSARAQDWTDYLHWPYTPPTVPGNGFQYNPLYDKYYVYPREARIVPQIQGPYYRNFYGGERKWGMRHPNGHHEWWKKKFYYGNHFFLDVF